MMNDSTPSVTAPDSPDTMNGSPASGTAYIRIPRAATKSGQDTNTCAQSHRTFHAIGLGRPHARPAMIVFKSPSIWYGFPSPIRADSNRQAAFVGSTMVTSGASEPNKLR